MNFQRTWRQLQTLKDCLCRDPLDRLATHHHGILQRNYVTAMKVMPDTTSESSEPSLSPSEMQRLRALKPLKPKQWRILASVLLSRPPILLPDIHPFEQQIQKYLETIERHQYARFPLSFFFKRGSIGEKRWKRQHPREPRRSGSGIIRMPHGEREDSPPWIIGGISDKQVINARRSSPHTVARTKPDEDEEELTDQERRDLEQYASDADEFASAQREVSDEVNADLRLLERRPDQTLYCLVKRSEEYHQKSGKPEQAWGLISAHAPGVNPTKHEQEGLHVAASQAIERHLGPRVQTWVVGTNPGAFLTYPHETPLVIRRQPYLGTREFIMKAHIFAGEVTTKSKYCSDYVWVTREEMADILDARTFKAISPLLSDR